MNSVDSYLPRLNDIFLFIIDKMISDGIYWKQHFSDLEEFIFFQWDPGSFRHWESLVLRIIFLVKPHF